MAKCNLPHEEGRSKFKVYEGRNTKQMSRLIDDDRVPANVPQIMQRRLELEGDETGVKTFYMNHWFDTGDAIVYHPDGRAKVVFDSKHLRDMTPDTPRNGGALILGEDVYCILEGEEFGEGEFGKTRDYLSKADVKAHLVWKALARGDQKLLNDYADYIFKEGGFDKGMAVYLGSASGDTPEMRAWYVSGLGVGSGVSGGRGLGGGVGRLLGIASETLDASGSLDAKV